MTGNELREMMRLCGLSQKRLAQMCAFNTKSKVSHSVSRGKGQVELIYEVCFENFLGKKRYEGALARVEEICREKYPHQYHQHAPEQGPAQAEQSPEPKHRGSQDELFGDAEVVDE
ncbi:MAG: hypothetical protein JNL32_00075 [Candidatus Kapabacteria bacterium]|nr:hypothetical protein [Candidatus Kapabacteria bacterium]